MRREAPITPLKLPRHVRRVLVYGGSFDPPHFYHTIGPLIAAAMFEGDTWVLYVPAARSPLKPAGPRASDEHRVAMLRLALDVPGPRSIWTDEIDRAAWERARGIERASYMIDTLRRLRRVVPRRVELRLLIGSDQVATFHRWKDARGIIRLAEPLVLVREPVTTVYQLRTSLDPDFWTPAERRAWYTRLVPNIPMEASSTDVRGAIPGAPRDPEKWERRGGLRGITTAVAGYIIAHGLYGFRGGTSRRQSTAARAGSGRRGRLPHKGNTN
jgi:nicotinate-nucleotide adenylyltransferase